MKKTKKTTIISLIITIFAIFVFGFAFASCDETTSETFAEVANFLCAQSEKTKPVISSNYENGLCEFVYDGKGHRINVAISSDQDIVIKRIIGNEEVQITNKFEDIGEYKIKVTADETMTYSAPDPLYLTVRVLPQMLKSDKTNSKAIDAIYISNDKGFCLDNSYSATDISRKQKREIKKAVKSRITYEEEILEIVKLSPNMDAENYQTMTLSTSLPKNFSIAKNYRFFEYKSTGELRELSYIVTQNGIGLNELATDSHVVITAKKSYPYLWIFLLIASLSLVGMVLIIYFFTPRKVNFFLEGSKIYSAKIGRRQKFELADGLENYEWYVDKNLTQKANSFGVGEISRNYYAKLKR